MPNDLITVTDLENFKISLIQELSELIENRREKSTALQWLRSGQVEKMLSISQNKLYQMRVNQEIPHYRFGNTIYYKYQDIIDMMKPVHQG